MKGFVIRIAIIVLAIIGNGSARPAKKTAKKLSNNKYLAQYGYLDNLDFPPSEEAVDNAVVNFQKYAGIPVTGLLDDATIAMLTGKRCGAKDRKKVPKDRNKTKRFAKQGTFWNKKNLTYSIHGYPTQQINELTVTRTLHSSFKQWQDVSLLTFKQLSDNDTTADIIINAYVGWHDDPYPFDGEGGTLAHAFYPGYNQGVDGDIHFDSDELWTVDGEKGTTDFTWTSLHEIGHAIGLDHAGNKDSVMWPWFQGFQQDEKLYQDDINGIQDIYGVPKLPKTSICDTNNFDAVMYHKETKMTYLFKGKYVWQMNATKYIVSQDLISKRWEGLEDDLDAAYTRNDGETIFFKGNRYWRYKGFEKLEGPHPLFNYIQNQQEVGLDKVEAAMVWGGNRRTYFFTGKQYWRYDEVTKTTDPGYPRDMFLWRGIKYPVDDVITWKNKKTYFFNMENIYKFRNSEFEMKIKANQAKQRINYFLKTCRYL